MLHDSPVEEFVPPPPAPVFEPSEAEFADPLAYIAKIRPIGEEYGIVKIKPPSSWQPPFAIDINAFEFTPRVQRLNELAAQSRVKLNFMDSIARFWSLQGTLVKIPLVEAKPLDLYLLYKIVERHKGFEHVCQRRAWPMIAVSLGYAAGQGTQIRSHYRRLILPYVLYTSGRALKHAKAGASSNNSSPGKADAPRPSWSMSNDPSVEEAKPSIGDVKDDEYAAGSNANNNNGNTSGDGDNSACNNGGCPPEAAESLETDSKDGIEVKNGGRAFRIRRRAALNARTTFLAAVKPNKKSPAVTPTKTTTTSDCVEVKQEVEEDSCANNIYSAVSECGGGDDSDNSLSAKRQREMRRLMFYGAGPKLAGMPEFLSDTREDIKEALVVKAATRSNSASNGTETHCSVCCRAEGAERLLTCNTCDESYHMHCLLPPLTAPPKSDASWKCPQCITEEVTKPPEEYGFEQAQKTYTLASFGEMADQFKADYFNMPCHMVPCSQVEKEFWHLISSPDQVVTVEYGADLQVCEYGSGFPRDAPGAPPLSSEDAPYAESPWNLNNLPVLENSMLNHIASDISGMKIPWVYVGMCFSTFCWHTEDHWSYSINYLHWGEPKTWYGVPGAQAPKFESAMTDIAPELFKAHPDIMHHLVTTNNPQQLLKAGVKISTLNQCAGEFVVTFPRAYHAGFNQGYNFAEAVNFCPADWLHMGRACVDHYAALNRFCVFAHDELVCRMASAPEKLHVSVTICLYQDMLDMVQRERILRKQLLAKGVKKAGQEKFELINDDDRQCRRCKTTCYLSALTCQNCPGRVVCLNHISELCECDPSSFVLRYRYTMDELPRLLQAVKIRSEAYDKWLRNVKEALAAPPSEKKTLGELKRFVDEANRQSLPRCDTYDTLVSTVRHADRCTVLAKQLVAQKIRTRSNAAANNNGSGGSYSNKLRLTEVESFHRQVANLACVIPEAEDIKAFIERVRQFSEDVAAALKPSPAAAASSNLVNAAGHLHAPSKKSHLETPDGDVIILSDDEDTVVPAEESAAVVTSLEGLEELLETAISFDLQLEELPRLRTAVELNKWVTRVAEHFPMLDISREQSKNNQNNKKNSGHKKTVGDDGDKAAHEVRAESHNETKAVLSLYNPVASPSSPPDDPGPSSSSSAPPSPGAADSETSSTCSEQSRISLSQVKGLAEAGRCLYAAAVAASTVTTGSNKNNGSGPKSRRRPNRSSPSSPNHNVYLSDTLQSNLSMLDAIAAVVESREVEGARLSCVFCDVQQPTWDALDTQVEAAKQFVASIKDSAALQSSVVNNNNSGVAAAGPGRKKKETSAKGSTRAPCVDYSVVSKCIRHCVLTPEQDALRATLERLADWRDEVAHLARSGACLDLLEDLIADSNNVVFMPHSDQQNNTVYQQQPLALKPITKDLETVIGALKTFYAKSATAFFDLKDPISKTASNKSLRTRLTDVLTPRHNVGSMIDWIRAAKFPPMASANKNTNRGQSVAYPSVRDQNANNNLLTRFSGPSGLAAHVDERRRQELSATMMLRNFRCDIGGPSQPNYHPAIVEDIPVNGLCCCDGQPCDAVSAATTQPAGPAVFPSSLVMKTIRPSSDLLSCRLCHIRYHVTCAARNNFGRVMDSSSSSEASIFSNVLQSHSGTTTAAPTPTTGSPAVKYWLCGHCSRSCRPSLATIRTLDTLLRNADEGFAAVCAKIGDNRDSLGSNQHSMSSITTAATNSIALSERVLMDAYSARITAWQAEFRGFLISCRQSPWSQNLDNLDAKLAATDELVVRGLLLEVHLPELAVLLSIRNQFAVAGNPPAATGAAAPGAIAAYETIAAAQRPPANNRGAARVSESTRERKVVTTNRGRGPNSNNVNNSENNNNNNRLSGGGASVNRRRTSQLQRRQLEEGNKDTNDNDHDDDDVPKKAARRGSTQQKDSHGRRSVQDNDEDDGVCSALRCLEPIGEEVDWVQCEAVDCGRWYHILCVGLTSDAVAAIDEYICYECCPDDDTAAPSPAPPAPSSLIPPPPLCPALDKNCPAASTTDADGDNKFLATVI